MHARDELHAPASLCTGKNPGTPSTGGCMTPSASRDLRRKKHLSPLPVIEPHTVQPTAY